MTVTHHLKELRESHNISREELADITQISVRSLSRYETGERTPTLEAALRLSAYYKLSVNNIFILEKPTLS